MTPDCLNKFQKLKAEICSSDMDSAIWFHEYQSAIAKIFELAYNLGKRYGEENDESNGRLSRVAGQDALRTNRGPGA